MRSIVNVCMVKPRTKMKAFISFIWERAPNNLYLSPERLRLAVYDDAAMFSDVRQGFVSGLRTVGVQPGYYTTELFQC